MNLIYFYILSTLYRKPSTKQEYNTILFLLLLSLSRNTSMNTKKTKGSLRKKTVLNTKKSLDDNISKKVNIKSFNNLNSDYDFNDIPVSKDKIICTDITNNIKHISNSTTLHASELFHSHNYNFNLSENSNRTFRLPTLLFKGSFSDSFKGDVQFCDYISSINETESKLIITSNLLLLDHNKRDTAVLFIDGYLETSINYSIPSIYKLPLVCNRSNYVIRIPFNISTQVNLQYVIPGDRNSFSNLDLHLNKSSFTIKKQFFENKLLEDAIILYKKCTFIIIANYSIEILKNELFKY